MCDEIGVDQMGGKMKNILLVCSAGMSTSLLVSKMQKVADARGIECNIEAHGNSNIARFDGKVDVCLVGPQIRYAQPELQKALPNVKVEVIDMRVYALGDGDAALDQALGLIEE